MMIRYIALGILLFIFGCSSGKRSFERGNYDQAVYTAVNRLQKDPDNSKALQTLQKAYRYAEEGHLTNVKDLTASADPLRWEGVLREYDALNRLADAILRCPSCRQSLGEQQKYTTHYQEARQQAAEARYARGLKLLQEKNRQSARQAYEDFERTEALLPGFKDARQKIEEAYWAAVLKVVVEPVEVRRGVYELSNEYFQNKIFEYLQRYEKSSFIKFYTPREARTQKFVPDQVLTLSFDDFVVGQTYLKEKELEVKRDSVNISAPKEKEVYATVKAQYITFEKTITSSGMLDFRVMDWKTKNIITQEKMPGTFVWQDEWATYKGDDRALTDAHKKMTKRKESQNPAPQFLFVEFTRPIYEQLTAKIQSFYRRY
jgi:hypothetical protein